jgi:hypothetical protein
MFSIVNNLYEASCALDDGPMWPIPITVCENIIQVVLLPSSYKMCCYYKTLSSSAQLMQQDAQNTILGQE